MQQQDVFDGTTQVFDALTGNHVFTYNAQNSGIVYAVAWSPVLAPPMWVDPYGRPSCFTFSSRGMIMLAQ